MAVGPTIEQLQILLCTTVPIACLVTYFRLYLRGTRGKLWWDDFWAFMSTILAIIFVCAIMLHVQDPTKFSQSVKISIYYMCAQFFYAVNWTARISILFTVIRMSFGRLRQFLFIVAIAFYITWAILFAQVWWVCEAQNNNAWKQVIVPQCPLGRNVAIAQVVSDVVSDTILIVAPVSLLLRARLTRPLKIRLVSVFAATSITTGVSLWHAYAVLRLGGLWEIIAAVAQLSISLLVTNLGVVVAFFFNLKHDDENDNTAPATGVMTYGKGSDRSRSKPLTSTYTVDTTVHVDIPRNARSNNSMTLVDKSHATWGTDLEMEDVKKV